MRNLFATSLALSLLTASTAPASVESRWREFHSDPKKTMNQVPPKFDEDGRRIPPLGDSLFDREQVASKDYVTAKAETRKKHLPIKPKPHFFGEARRRLDEMLDRREFGKKGLKPVYKLADMETLNLTRASLAETPWSGSYWPIYQGGLGARYASPNFQRVGRKWTSYYDFVTKTETLADIFASRDPERIDELSPAEKYDLLLASPGERGNLSGLTGHSWREGSGYVNADGEVETWMGLCHGWAPAAFSVPRPAKKIEAKASDGTTALKFYPADLKGLATHIWANEQVPSSFVGSRCNDKKPKKDPDTDRILDEACFDTNPAVWHVSMVNQVGLAKRSFVMDATYDYEVWNQPVVSYSYEYFDPQTGKSALTWEDAAVAKAEYVKDKFKKYRSPKAAKYVGVNMTVTYVVESSAFRQDFDSAEFDQTRTVSYMYDLELDQNDALIGGEWYTNHHPDFLWLPHFEGKPWSAEDDAVVSRERWTPDRPLPDFWKRIAVVTADQTGEPLPAIVEALIEASSH